MHGNISYWNKSATGTVANLPGAVTFWDGMGISYSGERKAGFRSRCRWGRDDWCACRSFDMQLLHWGRAWYPRGIKLTHLVLSISFLLCWDFVRFLGRYRYTQLARQPLSCHATHPCQRESSMVMIIGASLKGRLHGSTSGQDTSQEGSLPWQRLSSSSSTWSVKH